MSNDIESKTKDLYSKFKEVIKKIIVLALFYILNKILF